MPHALNCIHCVILNLGPKIEEKLLSSVRRQPLKLHCVLRSDVLDVCVCVCVLVIVGLKIRFHYRPSMCVCVCLSTWKRHPNYIETDKNLQLQPQECDNMFRCAPKIICQALRKIINDFFMVKWYMAGKLHDNSSNKCASKLHCHISNRKTQYPNEKHIRTMAWFTISSVKTHFHRICWFQISDFNHFNCEYFNVSSLFFAAMKCDDDAGGIWYLSRKMHVIKLYEWHFFFSFPKIFALLLYKGFSFFFHKAHR